jgi:hypothetical protein
MDEKSARHDKATALPTKKLRSLVNPKPKSKGLVNCMKLLDARVNGNPRQVNTKHGERSVLDVWTSEGEFTIWRPAGDREVMGRMNGERVSIAIDSRGKASLIEHASTKPYQAAQIQQMGFLTSCTRI